MKKRFLPIILLFLFWGTASFAVDFSGDYVLKTPDNRITLSLSQSQKGLINGTLSSTTGATFTIEGEVDYDVAIGSCMQGPTRVPFEAHFETNALLLSLIGDPGQETKVISFPLNSPKKTSASQMFNMLAPSAQEKSAQTRVANPNQQSQQPSAASGANNSLTGNWIYKSVNGNLTLQFTSSNQLTFNGDPASYEIRGNSIVVSADGETQSYPYSLKNRQLLITFPDGTQVPFAKSDSAVTTMTNASGQTFPQLIGRWKDIRSSGNTIIELFANGQFSYYSDYAAGNSNTGQTNWGYSNSSGNKGTWIARGTAAKGTIYYQASDGSRDTLSYQVHVERGQTYWNEYYFDGKLYSKQ